MRATKYANEMSHERRPHECVPLLAAMLSARLRVVSPPNGLRPHAAREGPLAQRQSRGLIILWLEVRILQGPPILSTVADITPSSSRILGTKLGLAFPLPQLPQQLDAFPHR